MRESECDNMIENTLDYYKSHSDAPYYELLVSYIGNDENLKQKYKDKIYQHNEKMCNYFKYYDYRYDVIYENNGRNSVNSDIDSNHSNLSNSSEQGENGNGNGSGNLELFMNKGCFDSGFDLFNPEDQIAYPFKVNMIDYQLQCAMKYVHNIWNIEHYCGYYLYPRSSTGTKTHLRLANSVGIIDSGYRGNIKAAFDLNISCSTSTVLIPKYERYTQICPPNLTYPMIVTFVERNELGDTERGEGGFGSTS